MKRKSINNLKSQKPQIKSETKPVVVFDGGVEVESISTSTENSRNAKPIVNSGGVIAYKVGDVRVQFHIY